MKKCIVLLFLLISGTVMAQTELYKVTQRFSIAKLGIYTFVQEDTVEANEIFVPADPEALVGTVWIEVVDGEEVVLADWRQEFEDKRSFSIEELAILRGEFKEGKSKTFIVSLGDGTYNWWATPNYTEVWAYGTEDTITIENIGEPTGIILTPSVQPFQILAVHQDAMLVQNPLPANMSIFTLSGVQLMQANLPSGHQRIDISALPRGVYLLRIGKQTRKFIRT